MSADASELDGLSPELRNDVQRFLVAVSSIELDTDGLPRDPDQALEVNIASRIAHRLVGVLRSSADTPIGSVRKLADEFGCLIAAFPQHAGSERTRQSMGRRWLATRAQAADLLGPTPASVTVPDVVPADVIESLRDSTAPDGPQFARLDPEDEVSPGEDIVVIEGGYIWSDGQPPQPLS